MDDLINSLEECCLTAGNFVVDNETPIRFDMFSYFTDIKLTFKQWWCIFGQIPQKIENDYIWKVKGPESYFVIMSGSKSKLLDIRNWKVFTNVKNSRLEQDFIKNMNDAIQCYNDYYKEKLETIIQDDDEEIIRIKRELIEIYDYLNLNEV